ncbi:hypothetical protein ET495_08195 [Xylanimonas allomyrinae]|uniref:Uncharacterized protein n=2 Tax=Xylanimonas TaxID=186188 RepID=A0A4P6F1T9_9MICO|nr:MULTISPECIES: hypothetical protein [Xylanimonas]QAY63226.1 hypothetical protein ET495_08195 [Xylanimonas allomyrinae]QAY68643.1 hypothetical protein ET471_00095 [Xylanimonas protaetiae]QAY69658.1 hypothetical protein ET471_06060 [Xylanimonas protaetiae]QAY70728.1 hypothetical protein ET471_12440 [Xylanimonas protaetiae]
MAGALLAGGLITACEQSPASSSEALTAQEVAARYGYDIDRETTTPVYALVPQFRDPDDIYARELLGRECLAGVVEYRPSRPGEDTNPTFDERTMQIVFTEEIAQQFGYPQLRTIPQPDTAIPDSVTITAEIQARMVECGQRADERLGVAPQRLLNAIEATAWMGVEDDDAVAQATTRWRECMAPVGLIDLPDRPQLMPTDSIRNAASPTGQDESDSGSVAASEWERGIAVADAHCRTTSGYDRAVHVSRTTAELAAIGADIEGFEAARAEYVEYQKGVDAVIAELGG